MECLDPTRRLLLNRSVDHFMNFAPEFGRIDGSVGRRGVNPVGKKHKNQLFVGVNPNHVTREAGMSKRAFRGLLTQINTVAFGGRTVPTERAVASGANRIRRLGADE